jgi:hypothetical protein
MSNTMDGAMQELLTPLPAEMSRTAALKRTKTEFGSTILPRQDGAAMKISIKENPDGDNR